MPGQSFLGTSLPRRGASTSGSHTVTHRIRPAPKARQRSIVFDSRTYTAFPQLTRLDGDELLMAYREAPRTEIIRHAHYRSVVTIVRSYDAGQTWELEEATQIAAGGGGGLALVYLGGGRVGGALAWHAVVPQREKGRAGLPQPHHDEYPTDYYGTYWALSENYGLTWHPEAVRLITRDAQMCAAPVLVDDGALMCPTYAKLGGNEASSSVVHKSTDGGSTWGDTVEIARGNAQIGDFCEPEIVETSPSHLLSLHRAEGGVSPDQKFWSNTSHDGGQTWDAPRKLDIVSGACPRAIRLRDGRILLTYGRRLEPFGIYARISDDHGCTWGDTEWRLRKGLNNDLGYTSSVQFDDGRVLTVTYAQNQRGITGIVGTFWNLP